MFDPSRGCSKIYSVKRNHGRWSDRESVHDAQSNGGIYFRTPPVGVLYIEKTIPLRVVKGDDYFTYIFLASVPIVCLCGPGSLPASILLPA